MLLLVSTFKIKHSYKYASISLFFTEMTKNFVALATNKMYWLGNHSVKNIFQLQLFKAPNKNETVYVYFS